MNKQATVDDRIVLATRRPLWGLFLSPFGLIVLVFGLVSFGILPLIIGLLWWFDAKEVYLEGNRLHAQGKTRNSGLPVDRLMFAKLSPFAIQVSGSDEDGCIVRFRVHSLFFSKGDIQRITRFLSDPENQKKFS